MRALAQMELFGSISGRGDFPHHAAVKTGQEHGRFILAPGTSGRPRPCSRLGVSIRDQVGSLISDEMFEKRKACSGLISSSAVYQFPGGRRRALLRRMSWDSCKTKSADRPFPGVQKPHYGQVCCSCFLPTI